MVSIESPNTPFTLLIDWLAFTLPDAAADETMTFVGGDWIKSETGFRGYPQCWMTADGSGGMGKLGTGSPRKSREVHVDLSGGIVSRWAPEKVQTGLRWVREHNGHVTRLDCALDDRTPLVPISTIKDAVQAGQAVTRAEKFEIRSSSSLDRGTASGETLYLGSPLSQTRLRIYDKRLELQHKKREGWEAYGVRWELELRKERADCCARALASLAEPDWHEFIVTLLRGYLDFRDTSRDDPTWVRCRAPLLPWWHELTEGFRKGRLTIEKGHRSIEDVKEWVNRSLAPMLAVVAASPEAGQPWLEQTIIAGADRWRERHVRLVRQRKKPTKTYTLKAP